MPRIGNTEQWELTSEQMQALLALDGDDDLSVKKLLRESNGRGYMLTNCPSPIATITQFIRWHMEGDRGEQLPLLLPLDIEKIELHEIGWVSALLSTGAMTIEGAYIWDGGSEIVFPNVPIPFPDGKTRAVNVTYAPNPYGMLFAVSFYLKNGRQLRPMQEDLGHD